RTIYANARSRDQAAGESARPTCSFLILRAGAGARTRSQAQNASEAFGILLVIAVAHGERRQVGAIQRVLRFTADDRHVSFVSIESDRAADVPLHDLAKPIQR